MITVKSVYVLFEWDFLFLFNIIGKFLKLPDKFILLHVSASTFGAVLDMVTDRYSLNKSFNDVYARCKYSAAWTSFISHIDLLQG